jgi:hypothetical protein
MTLSTPVALSAQGSILGQHTVNVRLKPSPIRDVLAALSTRSKAIAKMPDEKRPADEGRAWDVVGVEKLDGIIIAIDFVETPVEQLVTQVLGCVGFAYTEVEDRIVIDRAEGALPRERCTSVTRYAQLDDNPSTSMAATKFSFHSESISAFDFIQVFSREMQRNVAVAYTDIDPMKKLKLRVSVADMPTDDVMTSLFDCIGWKLDKVGGAYFGSRPALSMPGTCKEFGVL